MKVPSFAVTLRCRECGHERLDTKLEVDLMKFQPTCPRCGNPVEIVRPEPVKPKPDLDKDVW
jgi:NAD-dependent SIR2 family protein deacetylase